MKNLFSNFLFIAFLLTLSSGYAQKKRIAVFAFEDKTDRQMGWYYRQKGVGQGLADMLITELVQTGNYRVIERSELDELLKEQDLGTSGVVTPESAAEIGKVLGVELAVVGSVTEFGMKDNSQSGTVKGVGLGVRNMSAVVGLDCRIVNTSTAEILSAENVRKQKTARGLNVNTRKFNFRDKKEFDESLIGKASREAVENVIKLIDKEAPKVSWQASVVMEQNGKVYINAGSKDGLKTGSEFTVYRAGQALIDPETGLNLGSIESTVGKIKISNPDVGDGKASECTIVSGSGFERGDAVRKK